MVVNIIGKSFNRLTVIKEVDKNIPNNTSKSRLFLCQCSCGELKTVSYSHIIGNYIKSCGCLHIEQSKINQLLCVKRGEDSPNFKHGMRHSRIYQTWQGMIARCSNGHKDYGGRGIKVCQRWHKFENFYEDMKDSYRENLFIDRIDNDGDYKSSNCKWSTRQEQSENKRNTKYIIYNGIKRKRVDLAREHGINNKTLKDRIDKLGWNVNLAVETPLLNNKSRINFYNNNATFRSPKKTTRT
jgi:hypothetical protein